MTYIPPQKKATCDLAIRTKSSEVIFHKSSKHWAQPLNLKGKVKGFLQELRKVAILVDEARLEPFWEVNMAAPCSCQAVFGWRAGFL